MVASSAIESAIAEEADQDHRPPPPDVAAPSPPRADEHPDARRGGEDGRHLKRRDADARAPRAAGSRTASTARDRCTRGRRGGRAGRAGSSHPEDAVARRAPDGCGVHRGQRDAEHRARVARIDDAVVPQARGGEEGVRLAVDLLLRPSARSARVLPSSSNGCPARSAAWRRTIDRTPASCSGPITAMRWFGQVKTKRGS